MSTIAKIDQRVRRERYERRDVLRSLNRALGAIHQQGGFFAALSASVVHDHMQMIRRAPHVAGWIKQQIFNDLLNQLRSTNESRTAEPSAS